ncbi:recombinase family protein [Gordonia amicalis]|uniref:recombinase family protein n=1 Tax=Gordonia amicalis TaxID=89053 RepID=UPI0022B3F265|nr:recombinase family protein [Gordonia amicalis]MCZ4652722.1 recombinase family protein [Gordonia amicalis]
MPPRSRKVNATIIIDNDLPKAAIYARISLDKKGEGVGVDRQIELCRKRAQGDGYAVAAEHLKRDDSLSAYKKVQRDGYAELLDLVASGTIERVYVYSTDRLTRRTRDLLDYLEACRTHSVTTHAVTGEGIDPNSANSKLTTTILGAIAEQESEHKAERIRAAYEQRALTGKPKTGGRRMFGYEPDAKTIRKDEAAAIRAASEAILRKRKPASIRSIVAKWNAKGIKTTRGKDMDGPGLRAILKNPRIAGLSTWTPTDPVTGKRGLKTREVVGTGEWPAIIPVDQWERLQAVLNDPNRTTNKVGNRPQHLLSGILTCPCGRPMYYRTREVKSGGRYGYYSCKRELPGSHTHIGAEDSDAAVAKLIVARLQQADVREALAQAATHADDDRGEELAEAIQQRTDLTQRMADLEAAVADGSTSVAAFGRAISRVEASLAEVQERVDALAQRSTASPLAGVVSVSDVAGYWRRLDLNARRALVGALITVTAQPGKPGAKKFDPGRLQVTWKVFDN